MRTAKTVSTKKLPSLLNFLNRCACDNEGVASVNSICSSNICCSYSDRYEISTAGEKKFAQFAVNVWGISKDGKTDEELAKAGVEALANFIKEIGMPTTFKELGIDENINLKEIADSCGIVPGAYKKMTHEEILQIFEECK